MKLLIHLSLLLFLSVLVSCSEHHTSTGARMAAKYGSPNRTRLNILGNVKSIRDTNMKFTPDVVPASHFYHYNFDSTGILIYEKIFSSNSNPYSMQYTHDQYGNIIKTLIKGPNDSPVTLIEYTLDERGYTTKVKNTDIKTRTIQNTQYHFEYSPVNNMSEPISQTYFNNGILWEEKKTYDHRGNAIEISTYSDKKLWSRLQCRFNHQNRLIERKAIDPDLSVSSTTFFTYDPAGRVLATKVVHKDSLSDYSILQSYDAFGNEIEYRYSDRLGVSPLKSYKTIYEYDTHNNWIKKSTYFPDGQLRAYTERHITYY